MFTNDLRKDVLRMLREWRGLDAGEDTTQLPALAKRIYERLRALVGGGGRGGVGREVSRRACQVAGGVMRFQGADDLRADHDASAAVAEHRARILP